ncbi:MAG: hypothetical protein J5752_10195 [Clostridiales bacterium]|nr:hypothetical protein [Clostridiales bacterium]
MTDFSKRLVSVLLGAALLLSGCTGKKTSEETAVTTTEVTTETTTEVTTKEQVTSTEETESETTSDETGSTASSGSVSSGTYMPPDNMIKNLVAEMKQDQVLTSDMVLVLCENGQYKMTSGLNAIREMAPLMIEYDFSEERLNDYKEYAESKQDMTLDEYREAQKKNYTRQDLDKYLDDNYHLKERPEGRVFVTVYSELGASFDNDALIEECIRAGFTLFDTDPRLKESLDDALHGDYVHGNTAEYMGVLLEFDSDMNIRVQAGIEPFNGKEIMTETVIENSNAKIENQFQGTAQVKVANAFRYRYAADDVDLELNENDAKELFERLVALREDTAVTSSDLEGKVGMSPSVIITFEDTYKSRFTYISDGIWQYTSMTFHFDQYFQPKDQEAAERLLDELRMLASLPVISDTRDLPGSLKADFSRTYDSPMLSDEYPNGNYQALVFHLQKDSYWYYLHSEEGEGVFYFEEMHSESSVGTGRPNVISQDEYEYAGIPGEMYYRPDMTDVFYPAEEFAGHGSLSYLLKEKEDAYRFLYGIDVSNGTEKYRADVYENTKYRLAVLMDEQGVPFAGWKWNDEREDWDATKVEGIYPGIGIIRDIVTQDWNPEIEEYLEHARAHLAGSGSQTGQSGSSGSNGQGAPGTGSGSDSSATKSAVDWIREDQDAEGLPDLTGKIKKGDSIDHSPVMKDFLDYLDNDGPYSLEYWAFGCFKKYHGVLTVQDMDFYHSEIVASHDNSFDFDFLYVALGDYVYQGSIEDPKRYPKDEYFTEREVRLQLPDPLTPEKEHTFKRAYEGTIDGRAYTIEEWSVGGKDVIYYCQDGRLVGFRSVENGYTMFYHVVGFSESADEDLLVVPGN